MPNHRVLVGVLEDSREDRAGLDELELAEDVGELVLEQGRGVLEACARHGQQRSAVSVSSGWG